MVLLWLMIGAIINPNNFLIYASSVVTLVTFISSKYSEVKKIYKNSFTEIMNIVL